MILKIILTHIFILQIFLKVNGRQVKRQKRDSPTDPRIVGGEPAEIRDWPFIAAMFYNGKHRCGSSIITSECIVTAAHCITKAVGDGNWKLINIDELYVQVGSVKLSSDFKEFAIKSMFVHPEFNSENFDNDAALMITKRTMKLGGKLLAIRMPQVTPKPGETPVCHAAGWGRTEPMERSYMNGTEAKSSKSFPELLLEVQLPLITQKRCSELMDITYNMICTYFEGGGKDACCGDSGGPLVCGKYLAGAVSWGLGCAQPEYPGIYTDLSKYNQWLKEKCTKYSSNFPLQSHEIFDREKSFDIGRSGRSGSINLLLNNVLFLFILLNND